MGRLLRESLEAAPVVDFHGYAYFVHPLTDGIPSIEAALLDEVVEEILELVDMRAIERIVTVEAMGIPVATALSLASDVPLTIVRKRRYGLPGEVEVGQRTGYAKGALFVNGIEKGEKVLIIDDVISTGGTLAPLLAALRDIRADVRDVIVIIEKGDGRARVEKDAGISIKTLARIDVREGRVVLLDP